MIVSRIIAACVGRAWLAVLVALVLAAGCVWAIETRLGVTTDTGKLFAASLPWKQRGAELQTAFAQNEDLLVAVIDGSVPEVAEATAHGLAVALAADHAHFTSVSEPAASPYFERNAFMFLSHDKLQDILDRTIDAQPFLGQLTADPSLGGLSSTLGLIAEGVKAKSADLTSFLPALRGFETNLALAASGKPTPLSWEQLLAGPVADLAGHFQFVLAKPVLDYNALEPGAAASQALREAAAKLDFVRNGTAHVRITGSVALGDEEFSTVADGAVTGLIGSALLMTLWLFLAVRSWRIIVPIVLTLVLGLLLTGGFAALAVGTLNLVSVAFAILFLGIAVDFAIQFSVRLREAQLEAASLRDALAHTGRRAGLQILVAALATAAGFLAFTPTDFVGVAQLGLIAGVGMLMAFVSTITFLPSALMLFAPRGGATEAGLGWLRPVDGWVTGLRWPIVELFGVLGVLGLVLLPRLSFDSDPLHTKNPNTEAMRTLQDLMDDPVTSPYTMEMLAPDARAASTLADKLDNLSDVDSVRWLHSFLPEDQDEKLALIADAQSLLDISLTPPTEAPAVTPASLRAAVGLAATRLGEVRGMLPADSPLIGITNALTKLQAAPDATLLAANTAITRFLPTQLARLRTALGATKTTEADIPATLRRDWVAPDGRLRLEVIPKSSVRGSAALRGFVEQVQAEAPQAAGSAVTIVRSAETVVSAFRIAALSALAAITVILIVVLRRPLDVALVLAPLLLSSLLTVVLAVVLPLPLNFANVIALPLLLGVGVSFNIYFVMNWRAGMNRPLGSATARAVMFSALTTGTAFGSLALSHHPGTASMGDLLLLSLACTACTTLVFLPALLAVLRRPAEA